MMEYRNRELEQWSVRFFSEASPIPISQTSFVCSEGALLLKSPASAIEMNQQTDLSSERHFRSGEKLPQNPRKNEGNSITPLLHRSITSLLHPIDPLTT